MKMKFPFPHWSANTPVKVYQNIIDELGEPTEDVLFEGLAFYDEKQRQVLDAERRLVVLSGKVIIEGDIAPGKTISGYVKIDSDTKTIFGAQRPRNPDGSVYSTELDLM